LSVYFDEELSSPWKEKMETHLASCPDCRAQLEQYRRCSHVLALNPPGFEAAEKRAQARVFERLSHAAPLRRQPPVWRRRVWVPLPAAAAAAVFLLFAAVFVLTRGAGQQTDVLASNRIDTGVHGMVPISDRNDLFQYLEQDPKDMVIMRLPESKSFIRSGEPVILKAADYSGTRQSQ
jgi:anti-sigma factor RsiW